NRFLIPVHACGNRRCIHDAPPTSVEGSKADCPRVRGGAYLVRFQTTVAVPPPDAAGTVYCSSSPVTVNTRFCSVPSQLGNVAVSILKVKVLSAALTDKLPKRVRLPPTIALFSSAVAVVRLLVATLRRAARAKAVTLRPVASTTRMPHALRPDE